MRCFHIMSPPILLAPTSTNQTKGECMPSLLKEIEIYLDNLIGAGISQIPAAQIARLHIAIKLS